jgi:hypothetical protein
VNIHTGRPRELTFLWRLAVVLTWDECYHALVRREAAGKLAGRLRALSKKMVRLRRSGASILEIARLSAEMDRLGRAHEVRLYKPDTLKPDIDREIAEKHGISERMVRKIRDDPRLHPFRSMPPWEVPDWELAAQQGFVAHWLARQLMTPERLAKGEPVRIFNGGLQVVDTSILPIWGRMHLDAGDWGQPDWFATQMWLEEMRRASNESAELAERNFKKHTDGDVGVSAILAPPPAVIPAAMTVPAYSTQPEYRTIKIKTRRGELFIWI